MAKFTAQQVRKAALANPWPPEPVRMWACRVFTRKNEPPLFIDPDGYRTFLLIVAEAVAGMDAAPKTSHD